jgi:hypothetical protein
MIITSRGFRQPNESEPRSGLNYRFACLAIVLESVDVHSALSAVSRVRSCDLMLRVNACIIAESLIELGFVRDGMSITFLNLWQEGQACQNCTMNNSLRSHTPFAELTVQARVLFFIYALAATARFAVHPPTPIQLAPH